MTLTHKVMMYITALVLAVGYPMTAMASTQEQTPSPSQAQVTEPPSVPEAPVSEQPKEPELTYTYNPATGRWDSEKWKYNPATNTYEPPVIITAEPVSPAPTDSTKNVDTNVTVENNVNSNASSGEATVEQNTLAGNAASGNAEAAAQLVNIVNSTVTTGPNAQVAEFTQDIYGDVKGDILLSPMLLKAFLEAEAAEGVTNTNINTTNTVENNLTLHAASGNATVNSNSKAGNATSGSATAMANVVNILNSMIATQQSFNGTINIYGNLEGDILIAPDFIPQLIESNADLKNEDGSNVVVSSKDTQTIINNISAAAESGAAAVFGNTKAGNATSGAADTNVVIFNLTGHEIVAQNSLLVFINVMGSWVGAIVDAPQGATAAMISNGVSSHTKHAPNLVVDAHAEAGITNTITVAAHSGDATVSNNTEAGNATTGDAKAIVNVANMTDNAMNLTGWFGNLTINVFGQWKGYLGYDSAWGNTPIKEEKPTVPSGPIQFVPHTESTAESTYRLYSGHTGNALLYVVAASESIADNKIIGEKTVVAEKAVAGVSDGARTPSELIGESFDFRILIVGGSILLIGASIVGIKRLIG